MSEEDSNNLAPSDRRKSGPSSAELMKAWSGLLASVLVPLAVGMGGYFISLNVQEKEGRVCSRHSHK